MDNVELYLLEEYARIPAGAAAVGMEAAAFGAWLAAQADPVRLFDASASALEALRQDAPGVEIGDSVLPPDSARCDVAVIRAPRQREFARMLIVAAHRTLKPGGKLYLVGANAEGIKSAIKDAGRIFGRANTLGHKAAHRIAVVPRRAGPPAEFDMPTLEAPHLMEVEVPERVALASVPGVHSWQKLDAGTALLLENLGALDGVRAALDVACGCGVIGLALALRVPEAEICMTDDNLLAVRCAERGAHLNGVAERCRILAGDALAPVAGRKFDLIACNPPFHQGRDVEFSVARHIMQQAAAHLSDGGRFVLVANQFLRYEDDLIAHWGQVRTLAANDRFHVLEARVPR